MIKKIYNKYYKNSEFGRNVLTLMTGTTFAQAIPIVISPLLSRLYTPSDFGTLGVYMAIVMLFSPIASCKYDFAILIPQEMNDAEHLVFLSIMISIITSFILLCAIIFFIDPIIMHLQNESVRYWLYICPLHIFTVSVTNILYFWQNRNQKYKIIANNQIIKSTSQGLLSILLGLLSNISFGMIIGSILSSIISMFNMIKKCFRSFNKAVFSWEELYKQFKKYIHFPGYLVPSGFLENLSSQLPILMLGSFFGSHVVGLFYLSQRIIRIPIGIIGASIGNVFRQKASVEFANSGNCRLLFLKILKLLVLLSFIPFLFFYLIAPYLFSFIFGNEWTLAGEYARILTVTFFLQFITSPLSNMFLIAEKQKYDLIMQIYLSVTVFLSFYIGYKIFNSVKISLYLFSVVYSLKYIIELLLSYKFTIKYHEYKN